jgi:CRISPR-associated protein Csm2
MATRISDSDIKKIIAGDALLLVKEADRFGKELAEDKLSKSQIRNAYGTVRQIRAVWTDDVEDTEEVRKQLRKVLLLKPRLAYQAKRDKDQKLKPLADVLTVAIDRVADGETSKQQTAHFGCFVDMFEAILAYHTAYEKKG